MSYTSICNFGTCMNQNLNEPLAMCLVQGTNRGFARGPGNTNLIGPKSTACLEYMSERCAQNFDGYCDMYRNITNQSGDNYFPNTASARNESGGVPLGNAFMATTLQKALFEYDQPKTLQAFDPLTASSPLVTKYAGGRDLSRAFLSTNFDFSQIDRSQLMQTAFSDPVVFGRTLYRLYQLADANHRRIDARRADARQQADLRSSHTWYMLIDMFGNPQHGDRDADELVRGYGARKAAMFENMNVNSGGVQSGCASLCGGGGDMSMCAPSGDTYGFYDVNAAGVPVQGAPPAACACCPPGTVQPVA